MTIALTENSSKSSSRYASHTPEARPVPISIVRALSSSELTDIYKFRYEIYVDEMRLSQFYADQAKRTISDPLDLGADNFAAFQGGKVVGVLRLNFPRCSDISYYETFLNMKSAGYFHPNATSISTRLMVTPRLRGTNLAMRLCQAGYSFGLHNGIRYNFVDCDPHMIRFFEKLGYKSQGHAEHPEYGVGTVMRLDLLDRAHLAEVRSPFLTLLDTAKPLAEAPLGIA